MPILLEKQECKEAERVLGKLEESLQNMPISEARLEYLEYRIKHIQLCGGTLLEKHQQEYFDLNEALKQQNMDRLIIIEKLQRDELKKRLKLVSDNLQLKKKSEKQYQNLVIVFISLLVLVLIGVFVWWRATLLEEIQGRLISLRNKEDGIQEAITDLIQFLKSHAGAQEINDVIEQNIEKIGGDFRDRFFEKHDDCTPSEVQLVLLLKIGLSTKEMALMKSVEPS